MSPATYAEWHYWSQSEGSFWEKFWGDPTIVEGLAEMVLAMGAGAAKAAETLAWGRAYSGVQNVGNSNRYNADQTALIHLAQEAESRPRRGQGPLSANETNTLIEWAREYGLRVDADPSHLMDGHWRPRGKPIPHIHINRYHIPVPHNYTPR